MSDEVKIAIVITIGVIVALEACSMLLQFMIYRHQRRHIPTFPVRNWLERVFWDPIDRRLGKPTAAERRARRAPQVLNRVVAGHRHELKRLLARYPSLAAPEPAEPAAAPSAPRFGPPSLVTYRLGDYVEPLRCSVGLYCGGRELVDGEQYWAVPPDDDPASPFLVVCGNCVVLPEEEEFIPSGEELVGSYVEPPARNL